jgi:hypothetical protein
MGQFLWRYQNKIKKNFPQKKQVKENIHLQCQQGY